MKKSNSKLIEKEKKRNDEQLKISNKIVSDIKNLSEILKSKDYELTTKTKKIIDTQINNIKAQLNTDSKNDKLDNNSKNYNIKEKFEDLEKRIEYLEEQRISDNQYENGYSYYDEEDEKKKLKILRLIMNIQKIHQKKKKNIN